ncbi:MAG: VanZ family protein [Chloroflexi bacterium]|jgi:VanZ family protein|nr:VanZ family protein [Chloroflexota bacterium]MBT3669928.1 VanZ family protein [Chloroflexota bacterium]MBT4534669.1 VanZ family protein [Chloroflexota bacterium]MBT4683752.1 VanZ family protein [Chloroflexota bacterium]MBT4755653.1 VanZ family protein [Chloroflexota bacterium]
MKYKPLLKWIPALLIMIGIFLFSSIPATEMPSFGLLDLLVKKGAHMAGYGLLTLAYIYGFGNKISKVQWVVLFLAVLYALTDEWHQSYVPGRYGSLWDVVIDALGSIISIFLSKKFKLFDKF